MASKCVHKGCGKEFTDPEETCVYHPGPPVFHEGQKGELRLYSIIPDVERVKLIAKAGNAANRAS